MNPSMDIRKDSCVTFVSYLSAPDSRTAPKISGVVRAGYCAEIASTPSRSSTVIGSRRSMRTRCSRSSICTSSALWFCSCSMATEVSTRW